MLALRSLVAALGLLALVGARAAEPCKPAGKPLAYEPASVTLTGTVSVGSSVHASGAKMTYPILRLSTPVNVEPSRRGDPVNDRREACVREVHLISIDKDVHDRLLKLDERRVVSVTGSLFHAHTGWHVRNVVMQVDTLKLGAGGKSAGGRSATAGKKK